jgi:hypothetical protein
MEKITKKVLLEEIEEIVRINELIRFGSKSNVNEQVIPFFEKLIRGGEEGISDVVKTIERSGIKGADDVASAFRGLVEKGFKTLSQEESLFLSNVIRQVFPDISSQVSRDLSSLMTPYLGQVGVGKLEGILSNERFSTEQIYRRLTTDFGMENLSMLELQVWRDALKGKPIDVRIPTTVEVRPKPENITQPTELKLTPAQTEVVEEISQKVDNSLKNGTTDVLSGMPNINDINQLESWYRQKLTSMGATPLEIEQMVLMWKNTTKKESGNPELMRALDVLENTVDRLSKSKTPEQVEKIVGDKISNSPTPIKNWLQRWWENRKSKKTPATRYLNLALTGIQVGLLVFTAIKDEEDKYKGPFGISTEQTFISKAAVLTLSLLTTKSIFTFANTLLTWWDIKNAWGAAEKPQPIKTDGSTSDSTKVKPENSIRDIANLLSINDARQYVESAENPLNIPTEDKITYVLYDSKGSAIKDDTGNKKGVTVGVFINGEAYTQLIKDLSQKIKEKE